MEDNYIVEISDFEVYREDPYFISMTREEKETIDKFLKAINIHKYIKISLMEKEFLRLGDL